MEPPKPDPLVDEGAPVSAVPLYEHVKINIYYSFNEARALLRRVHRDNIRGRKSPRLPDFISAVLSLYELIRDKVQDQLKREPRLAALYNLERYETNPRALTQEEAIQYFLLMRTFLEHAGYFRVEVAGTSDLDYGVKRYAGRV